MTERQDAPEWTHPHAHFHEGISLYFRSLWAEEPADKLLNGLFSYVRCAMRAQDNTLAVELADAWNRLADLAGKPGAVSDGPGARMSWDELRSEQAEIIFYYGHKAHLFDGPDARYNTERAERRIARFDQGARK